VRAVLLLLALLAAPAALAGDARLLDQYGHRVAMAELDGHWLLVYFGYASCPDLCPAALTTMSAALARLGPAGAALTPIFVSLDPARDSPQRLRAYAAHFSPRLVALTGEPAALADAARAFGVPWQPRAGGAGYDHGVLIYLVAPGGRVVEAFHPEQPVEALAGRVRARLAAGVPR
jgi:protein SCO1/2